MLKHILISTALLIGSVTAMAENKMVEMETSLGTIEIELFNDKAPISAANFENYASANFYNGTIFHRVIPNFMVQGGGLDKDMKQKQTQAPIKNESDNGLKNVRGTLAMARLNAPDSASSQFFINVVDNHFLDRSERNAGYAVFGQVVKGMEIVEQMIEMPTSNYKMYQDVPVKPIEIKKVTIKQPPVENIEKESEK